MLLPLHCGVHHHPCYCTALHCTALTPQSCECELPTNMRRTTKTSTTTQTKRREEKRREGIVGVCRSDASLIPNSENCK